MAVPTGGSFGIEGTFGIGTFGFDFGLTHSHTHLEQKLFGSSHMDCNAGILLVINGPFGLQSLHGHLPHFSPPPSSPPAVGGEPSFGFAWSAAAPSSTGDGGIFIRLLAAALSLSIKFAFLSFFFGGVFCCVGSGGGATSAEGGDGGGGGIGGGGDA